MRRTVQKTCQDFPMAELLSNRQMFVNAARRIVGCPHLAEDIVQDAIIKLWEAPDRGDIREIARYLSRMVHNLSIDHLRRRGREPVCLDEALCATLACERNCDPSQSLQSARALKVVCDALEELPKRTRDAFVKHRIDGVPQKDIARQLAVSPTLVNFMVRDAHAHCHSKLQLFKAGDDGPCEKKCVVGLNPQA